MSAELADDLLGQIQVSGVQGVVVLVDAAGVVHRRETETPLRWRLLRALQQAAEELAGEAQEREAVAEVLRRVAERGDLPGYPEVGRNPARVREYLAGGVAPRADVVDRLLAWAESGVARG